MEAITSLLAVITGLLLRLALPIVGTAILIYLLRKLDAHWQTQAQLTPIPMEKVECWKVKGCSLEQQKTASRLLLPVLLILLLLPLLLLSPGPQPSMPALRLLLT